MLNGPSECDRAFSVEKDMHTTQEGVPSFLHFSKYSMFVKHNLVSTVPTNQRQVTGMTGGRLY